MRIGSKSRTWLGRSRLGRFVFWLRFLRLREQIARRHLRGNGIEIGALHLPLRTPHGTSVTYVDNWTAAELREQFPELAEQMTVSPDVIDDGTRLDKFADRSQDFVIANHFLEHSEDPIGVLKTLLRVTKSSGSIYLAVPDKRRTFDSPRPTTSLAHLIRDHEQGPEVSRREHYEEWVRLIERDDGQARVEELLAERPHIHFHVWTHQTLIDFLNSVQSLGFQLVEARSHRHESVVVLRRR